MGRGKEYTDREKAEALTIVDMQGGNVNQASKMTGIPVSTLAGWDSGKRGSNADIVALRQSGKIALENLYEDVIRATLESMLTDGSLARANFQQKGIVVGILHDKRALLMGQPTSITESLMSDEARAERVAILMEQARQRQLSGGEVSTIAGNLSPTGKSTDDDDNSNPPAAAQPTMTR